MLNNNNNQEKGNEAQQKNSAVHPRSGLSAWLDSTTAKVTGAVVAIGATLITARTEISRAFFKSTNKGANGAFTDLQKIRDDGINAVTNDAKFGRPVPDAMDRIKKITVEYDRAYMERRKMLGIRNMFNPLSVFDEAKALKRHQWLEVIFATAAVASIAVGAILTISSSRGAEKRLDDLEENKSSRGIRDKNYQQAL